MTTTQSTIDAAQNGLDAAEPVTGRAGRSARAPALGDAAGAALAPQPRASEECAVRAPAASAATQPSPPTLHAAVTAASLAAQRAGAHAEHAALHSLEMALSDVRLRLRDARQAVGEAHSGLLTRFDAIV